MKVELIGGKVEKNTSLSQAVLSRVENEASLDFLSERCEGWLHGWLRGEDFVAGFCCLSLLPVSHHLAIQQNSSAEY